MQISKIIFLKVKNILQRYYFLLKIILPLLVICLLFRELHVRFSYSEWKNNFLSAKIWPICVCLGLVWVNVGLDAWRWRVLNINQIKFFDSLHQVCISLASQLLAPMLLADWAAKVGAQAKEKIGSGTYNWFINNTIQTLIHSIAGMFALMYFWSDFQARFRVSPRWLLLAGFLKILAVLIFWLLAFNDTLIKKISKNRLYSARNHVFLPTYIFGSAVLAALRFLVYSTQMALLLYAFGIDWPAVTLLLACWLVFFAKSVTITLGLVADLGVRQIAALWVLGSLGAGQAEVVLAVSLIWVFNLCLPALPALWWMRKLPILQKKPIVD